MDIEYHYYITYLIANISGFHMSEAYAIAYSSQYVDDNCLTYKMWDDVGGSVSYENLVSALNKLPQNIKKVERMLIAFHFLPGDKIDNRKDGKTHILNTTKNSKLAKIMLRDALHSRNLYWIGIASHVFVDTWAHQNFVGTLSDFNALEGPLAELLPNIGHMDALDKPDLVGLIWQDKRLKRTKIDNIQRFLAASKNLIKEYVKYTKKPHCEIDRFLFILKSIMMNDGKNGYLDVKKSRTIRFKKYNELAKEFTSFDILRYDKNKWRNEAVEIIDSRKLCWKQKESYKGYHWYQFQEAVKLHQHYINLKLTPVLDKEIR